ncbi:uncharacterized protein LOC141724326 isoform X2 [Apium graveolens]|uniref:uncharacterized protein LOC141724326 isoform X2 n=1 Tax=Apium graveolens TaxID=4045 RepID=UPI003D7933B2
MVLSTTTPTAASRFPVMALPSSFKFPKGFNLRSFETDQNVKYFHEKEATQRSLRKMVSCSVSKDSGASVDKYDVPFPSDYDQLLQQAREASELALKDKIQLMEIEFPTAGLDSVPGDGEGGIEMTGSMQLIREFCDLFIKSEKVTRTRIFFPEANEVIFARGSVFEGASFKLDYLTKPSFFEDFGFTEKVKMTDRVKAEDELFVVAYPYFNVNDYPAFFYPKLAALTKTLFPKMETVYYIHNFKGRNGGTLFRCYPGPWKVLRRVGNKFISLHEQDSMPSLKEVALDILPSA